MSRQRLLLLLFVALGLALTYAWFETPRQQRVSQRPATVADNSSSDQQGRASAVGLDFSAGEKRRYKKPKRDLFRALYSKPKPVAQVVVAPPKPEPEPIRAPAVVPTRPLNRPVVVPKVGFKPIPPLKILGYLQKGASQSVFLASVQGDIYIVKRGERFADGLLVRDLNPQQIVISRSLKDPGITLQLSKNNNGQAAVKPYTPRRSMPRMNIPQMKTINPQSPAPFKRPFSNNGKISVDP